MKQITFASLLVLMLMCLLACFHSASGCNGANWTAYKAKYQKQYKSLFDDLQHRSTYCNNLKMITEHNERYKRGEETFEMGVNQFADWTHDEYKTWIGGGQTPEKY